MAGSTEIQRRARVALAELVALRSDVAAEGQCLYRSWRPRIARRSFAPAALNFAHYLALRRRDLRPLQRKLMSLGVSSLGRAESRVLATLDAAGSALGGLAGEAGGRAPSARQFFRGEARLAANAVEIFGPPGHGRPDRIMVTLPTEAAEDPAVIAGLVAHGADAVRINCAHDGPYEWARIGGDVRAAEARLGWRVPILMDIAGPKVRTGYVLTPPDRTRVFVGDLVLLGREVTPALPETPFQMTCTAPEALDRLAVGNQVSIDDGKVQGRITGTIDGGFLVRIEHARLGGVKLKSEKGLNFPDADLGLDPLTDKDREDLGFIVEHADFVGYSFVRTGAQVAMLQAELAARTPNWRRLGLVGKIETPAAVRNLPEILVQAAGEQPFAVMIARGDLAVEMGFERVAEMQEEMLWLCEAAHVPVIWATQVLEDLIRQGLPSRGEMTDAAMAARAECVLLNKGPNVDAAVGVLDRLLRRMAAHQFKKTPTLRALASWQERPPAP